MTSSSDLEHPYDTIIAISVLCNAYADLREMRYSNKGNKPRLSPVPEDSPMFETFDLLEGEIERLVTSMPEDFRAGLVDPIAKTHVPRFAKYIPQSAIDRGFEAGSKRILIAITSGIEAFRCELDFGLYPSISEINSIYWTLLEKCEPPEAEDWRLETSRFIARQPASIFTTILWYVRERRENNNPINATLSVFLADLIKHYVNEDPDQASSTCRGAAIGSSTHDLAAMMLAGASLESAKAVTLKSRHKVKALLEVCASHHGRLAFEKNFGPLDQYFLRGEVPDYRNSASANEH